MALASKVKAVTATAPAANGTLPKGWRMVRFDELARMVNERVDPSDTDMDIYVGLEHLDSDTLKIRRWGTPSDVIGDKLRFRKGDIIFGRRRAYQRKLAVAEFDGICSAHAMVLRANARSVDPEFLPFLMQSDLFMQRAVDISVGSLSPTINWNTLCNQSFPLPEMSEQQNIAELLRASEHMCESTIDVSQAVERLRQSLVQEHFSKLRKSICPQGWQRKRLSSLFSNPKDSGYSDMEILSVTIDGRVVPRDSLERSVIDRTGSEKYLRVLPGDIVYNTMRMWQGSCGVADQEGLVSPAYTVLRKVESSIFHGFWNLAFHSPWMLDVFTRHSTGVAADRWRLYYRDFGKIEVNVPPLGVAHVVEREFNDLADAHAKTIAKHAAERQLHASLRNALLRGQTP
jgi:restriction endonuclease S subunit